MRSSKRDHLSKMTSAGDVRKKLKKYSKTRNYRFVATVGTINKNNLCLLRIFDKESGEMITHHAWIGNGKRGSKTKLANKYKLMGGDVIEFSAKIRVYQKPSVIGGYDYGFSEVKNIKVIEKHKPKFKEKEFKEDEKGY